MGTTTTVARQQKAVSPRVEAADWQISQAMVAVPGATPAVLQRYLAEQTPPVVLSIDTVISRQRAVWVWWRERRLQMLDDFVSAEVAKLDRLESEVWPLVLGEMVTLKDGKTIRRPKDMEAVHRLIQISERRSKLLGLDAPARSQQQSVNVHIVRGERVTGKDQSIEASVVSQGRQGASDE